MRFRRSLVFAVTSGLLFSFTAHAVEESNLLKLLVKKGLITQQEADALLKEAAETPATASAEANAQVMDDTKAQITENATAAATEAATAAVTKAATAAAREMVSNTAAAATPKASDNWYDNLKLDGYIQNRFTEQLGGDEDSFDVPADRSVRSSEGLMIRRGRIKLSGDILDSVYFYSQLDMQASVGNGMGMQARDIYFDMAIDDKKEHRIRAGLSKVPYGWVNLQSSQNRLAMERPEALNSAVEGERDYGIYYMYASENQRKLFKKLTKEGLKGSGDYGVFTVGAFNGQGLNRSDLNGEPHLLARLSVPWEVDSGQIFEAGIMGYSGQYVVTKSEISREGLPGRAIPGGGEMFSGTTSGFADDRVAASFIMYPQPFGIEAEWTLGRGPELNNARTRIESESLMGGYIQACYRIEDGDNEYIPFVRWNYYDGARKFATNSPQMRVNEFDIGMEFQYGDAWELVLSYTYAAYRTNTVTSPYEDITDGHRLSAQLQFNF